MNGFVTIQRFDAINLIRSKKIDIIFDIMGMTGENRLTLFKNRIAPINVGLDIAIHQD